MENKWFMDIIFDEFRDGKINLDKTLKLFNKMEISYDYVHVKKVFKKNDSQKRESSPWKISAPFTEQFCTGPNLANSSTVTRKTKSPISGQPCGLSKKEQFELKADERRAGSLISKYEPIEEGTPMF